MADLYAPDTASEMLGQLRCTATSVAGLLRSTDDWDNNWDHYEACPYDGAEVKCLHAKHDELEAFLKSMEAGPGTSVHLDGGRMRVAIERDTRYYHEDIKYTAGLSVHLYTGESYMCHRNNWSYKWYQCDRTSPMEVLMAYTKALSDALAINTLLPSGLPKPIVKSRQERVRSAKVQHETIKQLLDIYGKEVTLVDGSTLSLKGVHQYNRIEALWDFRTYREDLDNYSLVGIQVVHSTSGTRAVHHGTSKHLKTMYMGADIVEALQVYSEHVERIGIQPITPVRSECRRAPMREMVTHA